MYHYRYANAADLTWLDQAVAAAAWESLGSEQQRMLPPAAAAYKAVMQFRQMLGSPGSLAIIAQQGRRPIGYVVVGIAPDSSTDEPTGHLLDLWVAPPHRRHRVGTSLLGLAERWVADQGLRKMKLWSGLHNQPIVSFAQRFGYAPAGLIGVKDL